ncbi:MAG: transcriptional regulator EpsA [Methylophilaceae bacterium]|nr:transcriptional regulator EpsA [Methylophilaceae bacterium]
MLQLDNFSNEEHIQFMALLQDSLKVNSHYELFLWVQGRLQQFLPHDIMIAAWGDFSLGLIYFDVISAIPGIRTENINSDHLTVFLKYLFNDWIGGNRVPFLLDIKQGKAVGSKKGVTCEVVDGHFSEMKYAFVHAIKDFRGRHDCLYVLLSKENVHYADKKNVFELLLPYIDSSLRQVAHLANQLPKVETFIERRVTEVETSSEMSSRESEIMMWVRKGKTNSEIGAILDISEFTVKNHLQRIFKKLDVTSRAQAVAKTERRQHANAIANKSISVGMQKLAF